MLYLCRRPFRSQYRQYLLLTCYPGIMSNFPGLLVVRTVDLPGTNPCWSGWIMSFLIRWSTMCGFMIDSNIFIIAEVIDMGLKFFACCLESFL